MTDQQDNIATGDSQVDKASAEQAPKQAPNKPPKKTKKAWYKRIWVWLMIVLLLLVAMVAAATMTNEGSRRLLQLITHGQGLISYDYAGGNLQQGVTLNNVAVRLKAVDVDIEQLVVRIGWRALLQKELHFRYASFKDIQVVKKTSPSDEPFEFKAIKLPFTLRLDHAFVHGLTIHNSPDSQVQVNDIILNEALWSGDELSLQDSSVVLPFLSVNDIAGRIQFKDKYPLHLDAQLILPALSSMHADQIFLSARGDLDTIKAGAAIATPDMLIAHMTVHPVRPDVPYEGRLTWQAMHWPMATGQALFSKSGSAQLSGTAKGLSAQLLTDLTGKALPYGEYQAKLSTDFKQLDIESLQADLMDGRIQTQGYVNWTQQLAWKIDGRLDGLDAQNQHVPASIQPYLPKKINGKLFSAGTLNNRKSTLYAGLKLDSNETWLAGIARAGEIANPHTPMHIDARWSALNRNVGSLGMVHSPEGRVQLTMQNDDLTAILATRMAPAEGAMLPVGQYNALVKKHGHALSLKQLAYNGQAGDLSATAEVQLPHDTQRLAWQAHVNTKGFDPQQLSAAASFNQLSGVVYASGHAEQDKQIIRLQDTQLLASMPASKTQAARTVALQGNSSAAILFYPSSNQANKQQPTGMRGFAVQFKGDLKTPDVPDGRLMINVSGTPKLIKIDQFEHQGAAGDINLKGQVDLNQGVAWQAKGVLKQFNPGFFVPDYSGNINGQFDSTGHWQTNKKDIQLNNLNISGTLKEQPIVGQGSLNVELGHMGADAALGLKRFDANNLRLVYAGNQLSANGNTQQLLLDLNAPALDRLYRGLTGSVVGRLNVSGSQGTPDINVDMTAKQLGFKQLFAIEKATLSGHLPQLGVQPSQLVLDVSNIRRAGHVIEQAQVSLKGTQKAHVLKITGSNRLSDLNVQLAGGLVGGDWLGQIQQGKLGSKRITLTQDHAATLIYRAKNKSIYLDQHCWQGSGSQLCLLEPLHAGADKGVVSVGLNDLNLSSFQAFMPQGVAWTGKLFGHAKTTWTRNTAPTLDAEIYTDNGSIGLAPEDPQDAPLTLPYQRLSLKASTQLDGIKIRFDAKTKGIGAGYIDATINPAVTPKTVNGALVLNSVQLNIFKPFFPGMRVLNGVASLAGGVSGPLTGPDFYGQFNLKDGQVAMSNLPINLKRININTMIEGTEATLKGDFYSGDGHALLEGSAHWQGTPKIVLGLKGQDLLVRQAPMLSARVTPTIDVTILPSQQQVTVNGKVDIPNAVISMPQSSESVIAKSADVRIVRLDETNNAVLKAAKPWAINADINVALGDDVYFRGFGSSIPLGGQLQLTQRGMQAMRGTGAIGVRRNVTIEAYGQRLQLNRGVARFNGTLLQPNIDIDATKSISNRTVGIRVTGRADNPNIAIYNDAGLTEQESLNALLTGRIGSATTGVNNTAGFKSDVNNTIAAAGLSMGLGGVSSLTNQIGRTVGLNALTVDAEGVGDDTQVSLTGYITPDLFLRYGVGVFTPVNRLTLRYQMNRRLYIEASSALDRAIDMFYNWRF